MSDPIRGPGYNFPIAPLNTQETSAASQAEGAAASTPAMADPAQTAPAHAQATESSGLDPLLQKTAQRLHAGRIDMGEAIEELVGGAIDAQLQHLKPELRARMAEDLADAMFSDAYFILELEASLKRAVDRLS